MWRGIRVGLLIMLLTASLAQAASYPLTIDTDTPEREAALLAEYVKECTERLKDGPKEGTPPLDADDDDCVGTDTGKTEFIRWRVMNVIDNRASLITVEKKACRGTEYEKMEAADQAAFDAACGKLGK